MISDVINLMVSRCRQWGGGLAVVCVLQGCFLDAPATSAAEEPSVAAVTNEVIAEAVPASVASERPEMLAGLAQARAIGGARTISDSDVYTLEVSKAGNWYDAQLALAVTNNWTPGDALMLRLEIRATKAVDESAEGWVVLAVQQPFAPHTKIFKIETSVPQEWTTLEFPFEGTGAIDPATAQVILGFGKRQQRIELRSVSLTNYGDTPIDSLKGTELSYDGREPDAAWRAGAAKRIDQYRKADLSVSVVDEAGKPVPGAKVVIKQTRHAFPFGSAVAADLLLSDTPDAQKYQEIIERDFNRVVIENGLKIQPWEQNRQRALDALNWLDARDIDVRGHVLVWPSYRKMYRLRQFTNTPDQMEQYITNHIIDAASTVGNRVVQWDVLNEPYDNHDAMDILGDHVMVDWFKTARQAVPEGVELFINDYGILSGGGADVMHQNHYEKTIRYLVENGAPLDGIGLQSHFSSSLTSPDKVWGLLNRYGAYAPKLAITELDIDVESPELQADYLRDFMTLCFSHPQVDGILLWGFWEGRHWKPQCALYNKDWSVRPVGQAWHDLVFKQWWTDEQVKADGNGRAVSRVFLGEYEISAVSPDGTVSTSVAMDSLEGADVRLVLKK